MGVPILKFDSIVAGRVEVGLGRCTLSTTPKGTATRACSSTAPWRSGPLGEPYFSGAKAFQLVDKLKVNYNIGHLVTMEGDTMKPDGKYLVALNKWSIDRFPVVGTLEAAELPAGDRPARRWMSFPTPQSALASRTTSRR